MPLAGQIQSKSDPWTEGIPGIVDKTLGNPILPLDADAIQIERNPLELRNRARAEAWAGWGDCVEIGGVGNWIDRKDCCLRRIVQVGIEVGHVVIRLIGMRNSIPAQSQI